LSLAAGLSKFRIEVWALLPRFLTEVSKLTAPFRKIAVNEITIRAIEGQCAKDPVEPQSRE
jgi:hypothetical protein